MEKVRGRAAESSAGARLTTFAICALAGLMVTVGAIAARGEDLRADRAADLRQTVAAQIERNEQLLAEIEQLRADVERLRERTGTAGQLDPELGEAGLEASTLPVAGPAMRVVLTDAPADVAPAGVSDDALVVHQQDIQAVINALWAGGAEAMAVQGQRIIATTGIKCVGNSVVLHGIPYAPPYVIEAIGPQDQMEAALEAAPAVGIYKQYVEAYGLGYAQSRVDDLELAPFTGSFGINHAEALR